MIQMSDKEKELIDILQTHLVSETVSDNVLYIFDNEICKKNHIINLKNFHKNTPDKLFYTKQELYKFKARGLRYKRFTFVKCFDNGDSLI